MPLSDFLLRELAQRCDLTSSEGKAQLIYEAKPLLLKLPTPLLRLQLVKRLAEASGFAQQEVERLCNLRSYTPAAPPKATRPNLSLSRKLLRVSLFNPRLAVQLPVHFIPDTPERPVLLRLHELATANPELKSYAALREKFRGLSEEAMLESAASELLSLPLNEEEANTEFMDALEKIESQQGPDHQALNQLHEKARKFGVSGLSAAEKAAYIQLLNNQANRS